MSTELYTIIKQPINGWNKKDLKVLYETKQFDIKDNFDQVYKRFKYELTNDKFIEISNKTIQYIKDHITHSIVDTNSVLLTNEKLCTHIWGLIPLSQTSKEVNLSLTMWCSDLIDKSKRYTHFPCILAIGDTNEIENIKSQYMSRCQHTLRVSKTPFVILIVSNGTFQKLYFIEPEIIQQNM